MTTELHIAREDELKMRPSASPRIVKFFEMVRLGLAMPDRYLARQFSLRPGPYPETKTRRASLSSILTR